MKKQGNIIEHRLVDASDLEANVDQVSDLPASGESVRFPSLFFFQTDPFLTEGILNNFVQADVLLALKNSKSRKGINP